jgi:hypothetical protein
MDPASFDVGLCRIVPSVPSLVGSIKKKMERRTILILNKAPSQPNTKELKGKAVPLQAWSVPEGSRKLWFPDFMTTAQDGGFHDSGTGWW